MLTTLHSPKPKDVVAIILIICLTVLLLTGYKGNISDVLAVFVGYYFGFRRTGADSGH